MGSPWRPRSLMSVLLMPVTGPARVTARSAEPGADFFEGRRGELLVARPGDSDYRGALQYVLRASPHVELAEGVEPGYEEDGGAGPFLAEQVEGVGCVARSGAPDLDVRAGEERVWLRRELHHAEAMVQGGRDFPALQARAPGGNEEHLVEREARPGRFGHDEMAVVHRIEGAAEHPQPASYSHDHSLPPSSNGSPGPAPTRWRAPKTPARSR